MSGKEHWEAVYGAKAVDAVSWYRPHLERSLAFIVDSGLPREAPILDVGGGASTLVDDLLDHGYSNVTVNDLSAAAIERAQGRLGPRAALVRWIVGDITSVELPAQGVAFWHDRAVFHFLTEETARARYVAAVRHALKPGGHIVVATFGPEGPDRCSGLPVVRYSSEGIHGQFGGAFRKVSEAYEVHLTPWGSEQEFVYCYCRTAA